MEEHLQALINFLNDQRFDELSIQQLKMLTALGADAYMGPAGAEFVNDVVRTSNFDPATAAQKITEAMQTLSKARASFTAYAEAVKNLGFEVRDIEDDEDRIIIRIGFQNDVSIDNVTDWKDAGKEWYEIIRGLAMACDEKPEDVKVVGTATGSIILILAGTVVFTTLLARISKNITSVAMDVLGVRSAMEDLRQKGILTKTMEKEFRDIEKSKRDSAVTTIEGVLAEQLKGKDGEINTALVKSIEKLLTFSEKGGSVDFVAPEENEEEEEEEEGDDVANIKLKAALLEAREAIHEYQGQRLSLKLLSDGTKTV
ncbi:hypothetical protein ASD25_20080 [Brevundimonas sp. Root1423]|nr:hypothetical protein ASD25_20080 [Brevundimonas sp. Root1423]KRA28473.1 hypothetical protein ASD59_01185 [Brevundimonas sp. Root608]